MQYCFLSIIYFSPCEKFVITAIDPATVMVSESLELSCKVQVDNTGMDEMFWTDCTWTKLSENGDDAACRLKDFDGDNVMEKKCDASLEKAVLNKSADNSRCRIFLDAMQEKDKGVQRWRCRLQKCIDKRNEECRSDTAKQCVGEVIVNATVCT